MKQIYYAIQLDDDSYAMLEQTENCYVDVYSAKDISCASFYTEENIKEGFRDLQVGRTETIEFDYMTRSRPVGISRVTMEIEDKVDIHDFG